MKSAHVLLAVVILLGSFSITNAQQPTPADTSPFLDKYGPATYGAIAGEITFATYGFTASFPVLWIENRVKTVPLAGLFWNDFTEEGFDFNLTFGAKFSYYFRK